MKKSLLYTALGLMGIMGALAIGVVKAETTITHYTGSNISYTLNEGELFTGVGTITITDGTDTITILDRNLGAKKAGTGCEDSSWGTACAGGDDTYGYHFQWGNNYGFNPMDASIKENAKPVSSDGVVWSGIYDNSGYYGTTFIKGDPIHGYDYWGDSTSSSSNHENLRGGGGDYNDTNNGFGKNNENRRGPCPEGFHVPSYDELQKLQSMLNADGKRNKDTLRDKLLIPFAGFRYYYDASVYNMGIDAYLWSSSPYSASGPGSRYLTLDVVGGLSMDDDYRANAVSVRCFYDSYQHFPQSFTLSFISDGEKVGTGEVTENMTGAVPDEVTDKIVGMINTTKTGYILEYRYLSGADPIVEFDFTGTAIAGGMADDSGNVYFIAQWTGIKYEINFEAGGGTGTMENQTFTYDIAQNLTANAFTRNGYTFSGWTDSEGNKYTDGQEVNNLTTTGGEVITLTAEWTKNKTSGGSSGGGGSMKKDDCPDGDLSPSYYDGKCEAAETNTGDNKTPQPSADSQPLPPTETSPGKGQTSGAQEDEPSVVPPFQRGMSEGQGDLSQEQNDAYTFAFKNGITTMNTIDKANMDGYIKRGHLAKMITNYVVNVLGKEIPSDIPASCLSFSDETTVRESEEIKDYAIKSCALGLMGINMKNNEFLPNDYVTRAEFGTVLSRVLWGDKYNLVGSKEKPRYSAHLNTLNEEGIMKMIDNPKMLEKRGYVMIMIMRSTQ